MPRLWLVYLMLVTAIVPARAEDRLNVVASFSILGDFVRNVRGDRVNVTTLVGPNSDVHVYTPAPADAKKIADAKLVIVNGLGLEGWLPRLVQSSGSKALIVTDTDGIAPRKREVPGLLVVPVDIAAASGMRKLPIMYAPPIPIVMRRIFHTVRPGETFDSIAERYGVIIEDIKRWNRISRLATGQRIALEVRAPAKKGKPRSKPKGRPYRKAAEFGDGALTPKASRRWS